MQNHAKFAVVCFQMMMLTLPQYMCLSSLHEGLFYHGLSPILLFTQDVLTGLWGVEGVSRVWTRFVHSLRCVDKVRSQVLGVWTRFVHRSGGVDKVRSQVWVRGQGSFTGLWGVDKVRSQV